MRLFIFCLISLFCIPSSICILNGQEAQSESVTYLASVRRKKEDILQFGEGHVCGGTLITFDVVLTASVCLTEGSNYNYLKPVMFRVVGGDTIRTEESKNLHITDVRRIVHHEKVNHYTGQHNLALVTLTTPVSDKHRFFRPISLGMTRPEENSLCTMAGWGIATTKTYDNSYTKSANIGKVSVYSYQRCTKTNPLLPEGSICYSSNDTAGACNGDEGGPLIFDGRLVGILQRVKHCNAHEYPGFTVDVYQHINWINKNIYEEEPSNGAPLIVLWDLYLILMAMIILPEVIEVELFSLLFPDFDDE